MTKRQIAILASLALAVICELCAGAYIIVSEERSYQDAQASTPQPAATRSLTPTWTPQPTWPPTWTAMPKFTNTPVFWPTDTPTLSPVPTDTPLPTDTPYIAPTQPPAVQPPPEAPPPSSGCCKHCGPNSQPCGDSCISLKYTCHKGQGCACW
jgi:hypothetical protein